MRSRWQVSCQTINARFDTQNVKDKAVFYKAINIMGLTSSSLTLPAQRSASASRLSVKRNPRRAVGHLSAVVKKVKSVLKSGTEVYLCNRSARYAHRIRSIRVASFGGFLRVKTDFRARIFQPQKKKRKELTVKSQVYGTRWQGLSARYDRVLCSWKTVLPLFSGDLGKSCTIFPRWGSMRNGVLSERIAEVLRIKENVFGFWLGTPLASDAWRMRFRPKALIESEFGVNRSCLPRKMLVLFGRTVTPELSSWLMGFPERWTSLEPLETPRFHAWRQQHSGFCIHV